MRKCLFIALDSGASIRNILRTDVLKVLQEDKNLDLVVFSPITDPRFKNEFKGGRIIIEPLPQWPPSKPVRILRSMKKDMWAEQKGIFSFGAKRNRRARWWVRKSTLAGLKTLFLNASFPRIISSLEKMERRLTPPLAEEAFQKYKPDLVFYTTLYSKYPCLEIGAQQRGVKSVCLISSWDNPTTKGPFFFHPDKLIVWNDILKQELQTYHDVPEEDIYVAGIPQFDIYLRRQEFRTREDFCRRWKLDPAKKLITYTTGTVGSVPFDHEIVQILYESQVQGAFNFPTQLLARLHPKDDPAIYKRFEGLPGLVLQLPGDRAETTNDRWNPSIHDMYDLAELMCYSDVVINVASTITLDAIPFDKPIINIAFDGFTPQPFKYSCLRFYQYEHYRNIVKTGGVRLAYHRQELVEQINAYLKNPQLDSAQREIIRQQQCWKLDGRSSRRVAEYLLETLYGQGGT